MIMKKFFTVLMFIAAGIVTVHAQRRATVSGVVADAETKETLTGAVVRMIPVDNPDGESQVVTGAGGTFSTGLTQGSYNFDVSLLGYQGIQRRVEVVSSRMTVDTLFLLGGMVLDEIVKQAVALRTSLEGDTLIYNADSFKVAADSDVSGLLQKMPGIKVENGQVEAQGESVRKVLIDGREFFGEDVNAAITSLPAEIVKSIEVFDKLSDNAEFTGIDDGEGYKAINIRTRESMRQGVMGQVSALYGVEPPEEGDNSWNHYGMVSGNVSIFQGDAKITVGGTFNNLNQRNYTSDDFLGAGGGDGIARVGVFQTNYIDTWGKKDQWKIDATYRFNSTDADNVRSSETEFFDLDQPFPYQNAFSTSNRTNNNHTFRARIDFKPNQYQELRIRPFIRYQGNSGSSDVNQIFIPSDLALYDTVTYENWSNSRTTGWNVGMDVNYRVRLGKPGRTLTTRINGGYNSNVGRSENFSQNLVNGSLENLRRRTPSTTFGYNVRGGITYTEPVSKSSLISLEYNLSYEYQDIDRKRYDFDFGPGEYNPTPNVAGSGVYNSTFWTHRVGPGYRIQTNGTTLSAGVFFEYSTLTSESVMPKRAPIDSRYYNPTYMLMINSKFKNNASLRLFFNSRTSAPSVSNLQDAVNLSDEQNISIGDPNLKLTYTHRLHARLILPNVTKGRTFSLHLNGTMSQNYVSYRTLRNAAGFVINNSQGDPQYTLTSPTQTFSKPVNLDGFWNVRLGADYGLPLTFIKSNLNLQLGTSYQETPTLSASWDGVWGSDLEDTKNNSRNLGVNGGLVLGSNISQNVDFTIGYNLSYNNVWNTTLQQGDNTYLRHTVNANFKVVLPAYFTLSGDAFYTRYNVLTGRPFDQQYVLLNAGIGKKIFRSKQGEITLFCNDILNQNTSFQRQWNADNMASITNNVIGRYFGIKLTWNIRKFGKNGSQNPAMYENTDGERRFDGPPPGMGGGRPPGGGGGFGPRM